MLRTADKCYVVMRIRDYVLDLNYWKTSGCLGLILLGLNVASDDSLFVGIVLIVLGVVLLVIHIRKLDKEIRR